MIRQNLSLEGGPIPSKGSLWKPTPNSAKTGSKLETTLARVLTDRLDLMLKNSSSN